jgi:DNA polymerase-3 subunit gamma/tau
MPLPVDRVAHAILFSGPQGHRQNHHCPYSGQGHELRIRAHADPCNTCRSCTDITAGRGADVFEIDGASNNSVDQVRELRENIEYMPAHSRYQNLHHR